MGAGGSYYNVLTWLDIDGRDFFLFGREPFSMPLPTEATGSAEVSAEPGPSMPASDRFPVAPMDDYLLDPALFYDEFRASQVQPQDLPDEAKHSGYGPPGEFWGQN